MYEGTNPILIALIIASGLILNAAAIFTFSVTVGARLQTIANAIKDLRSEHQPVATGVQEIKGTTTRIDATTARTDRTVNYMAGRGGGALPND